MVDDLSNNGVDFVAVASGRPKANQKIPLDVNILVGLRTNFVAGYELVEAKLRLRRSTFFAAGPIFVFQILVDHLFVDSPSKPHYRMCPPLAIYIFHEDTEYS